jgi:hypothetical protein
MTETPPPLSWSYDIFEAADRPAVEDWEVECTSVGPVTNPHYILSVRHRTGRASRVLVTTNDPHRLTQIEGAARRALHSLRSQEFVDLLGLPLPEERAAAIAFDTE